ncbi:MAG: superinfection immunity protein [Acetobacteraceae bacterium]|nr:superinfection immunity protein [Acetobacteraceae bacterium]
MSADGASVAVGIILILAGVSIYLLPFSIGCRRKLSSLGALFFVNVFFGWTLLGWFACLIWAAAGATKAQDAIYAGQSGAKS